MSHIIQQISRMFEGFSMGSTLGKIGIAVGAALTALYAPIAPLLVACFAFTVMDMIYGIKVAIKQHNKITSDKNWKGTIVKLFDEFSIISLARILEFAVLNNDGVFVLTGGATVIMCLTEMWSILENLNTLNPNGPWKALGKFLKKKGEDYIGTEIQLDDDENDSVDTSAS